MLKSNISVQLVKGGEKIDVSSNRGYIRLNVDPVKTDELDAASLISYENQGETENPIDQISQRGALHIPKSTSSLGSIPQEKDDLETWITNQECLPQVETQSGIAQDILSYITIKPPHLDVSLLTVEKITRDVLTQLSGVVISGFQKEITDDDKSVTYAIAGLDQTKLRSRSMTSSMISTPPCEVIEKPFAPKELLIKHLSKGSAPGTYGGRVKYDLAKYKINKFKTWMKIKEAGMENEFFTKSSAQQGIWMMYYGGYSRKIILEVDKNYRP